MSSKYTKLNVRQDLYDQLKIMAAADNRSLTNYVEQLLKRHVAAPKPNATLSNLEGDLGSSQDSATPKAQGHEADNFNAGANL